MRVLIAEDDENLGEVLARGLKEQGYVVDLVPDGETAWPSVIRSCAPPAAGGRSVTRRWAGR